MIYLDHDFITSAVTTPRPKVASVTGYGNKLPTHYKVKLANNRWYRVYAKCWSNAASFYIRTKNAGERYLDPDCWERIATHADGASLP
jgi:hypothetical protein